MGSLVAPCDNVDSVREAYQTKLQAALGIPATSAREKVRKAAALGVLTGLDENGCFDDLEIHGYNTLAKLGAGDKNKKMEAQEDGEALSAMAKPLGDAKDQFKIALYFFNKEDGDKGKNEQKQADGFEGRLCKAIPGHSGTLVICTFTASVLSTRTQWCRSCGCKQPKKRSPKRQITKQ